VAAAAAADVPCVLNPAPVLPGLADLLVPRPGRRGPLLTPNAGELAALTGAGPPDERAAELAARTGAPVVVTLGGDGALVVGPGGELDHLPPFPATVRDTTGAGDTFNGVLAVHLAAAADLAIASDRSSAILRVRGMPRLRDDRVYQVWVQRGGALEPDALFRVDRDGRGTAAVDRSLDGADAVMVTREPDGGSDKPSEPPVLNVEL
jgi:hypothetical protein